jgi:hypothetical protein
MLLSERFMSRAEMTRINSPRRVKTMNNLHREADVFSGKCDEELTAFREVLWLILLRLRKLAWRQVVDLWTNVPNSHSGQMAMNG